MKLIDTGAIPWNVAGVGEIPVITKEEIDRMPQINAVPLQWMDRWALEHGKPFPKWFDQMINDWSETNAEGHGCWKERKVYGTKDTIDEVQSARCSACGRILTTPYMYYFSHYNYCPSCGARMDRG